MATNQPTCLGDIDDSAKRMLLTCIGEAQAVVHGVATARTKRIARENGVVQIA